MDKYMTILNKSIKQILAILIVVCSFTYYFYSISTGKHNDQILIAIVSLSSTAVQYYLGSSTRNTANTAKEES